MKKALEEAEKKARIRDFKVEELINQAQVGLSTEQQRMLMEVLHNATGENYFIGKRKKKTDGV
ncbi:MarR family transcriptional regulator, partial [Priestia megaterium]